ncbi:unnamed protein product [Blepharisma stoltei]|uniref:Uncharacterized protein n=1 Tax=Blepharisma stoltei TaxID=1481888 RepID=A0AAU9KHK9_9CILI|nr:unnamed protein product [Blepharisma stoltei]
MEPDISKIIPCASSIWSYYTLFTLNSVSPLTLIVPETIIVGFGFSSITYMHNRSDGSLCFEEISNEATIKRIIKNWDQPKSNGQAFAIVKYLENTVAKILPLTPDLSSLDEPIFLQNRNKIIQENIHFRNSSENQKIKVKWKRKQHSFEFKINSPLNDFLAERAPNSYSQRTLATTRRSSSSSSIALRNDWIRKSYKDYLKNLSSYIISNLYTLMKKYYKEKLSMIEINYEQGSNGDWFFVDFGKKSHKRLKGKIKLIDPLYNTPCLFVEKKIVIKEVESRPLLDELKKLEEKMKEIIKKRIDEDTNKASCYSGFIMNLKRRNSADQKAENEKLGYKNRLRFPTNVDRELTRVANLLDKYRDNTKSRKSSV